MKCELNDSLKLPHKRSITITTKKKKLFIEYGDFFFNIILERSMFNYYLRVYFRLHQLV